MSNQHVTKEEWQLFYMNNQQHGELRTRILTHVMGCRDCRAFYDAANELARAARAYADAVSFSAEEDGYAAVASPVMKASTSSGASVFTVSIDANAGSAIFLDDTIEATGSARKYAANVEQNGACLQEDGDAFTITLEGSRMHIVLEAALAGKVSAALRSYEGETALTFDGAEAFADLPDDDIYILELTFA